MHFMSVSVYFDIITASTSKSEYVERGACLIGFKGDPLMSEKCEGMVFKRHRMEKVVLSVLIKLL